MEEEKPTLVALYARVSTKGKRQDTLNQLLQLREYCKKMNWAIYQEYVEHEKGDEVHRKAYEAMFADAHQRKFDIVLTWAFDRFHRGGALATLQDVQTLNTFGVGFKSYSEPYVDTLGPWKDVIIAWITTIAKQEKIRRAERVHAGLDRARLKGKVGGRPTLAKKQEGIGMQLDELKQKGLSNRAIAQRLHVSHTSVNKYFQQKDKPSDANEMDTDIIP